MTLTVYQEKPSKNVFILSTMYRTVVIEKEKKKLLKSMIYYNTKTGVENVDEMARL